MRTWCWSVLVAAAALAGCGEGEGEVTCDEVSFPAAPGDSDEILYVAAPCDAATADGSVDRPYAHIADAIEHAKPGATILIAKDTFYGESLYIDKPLRLLGAAPGIIAESATVTLKPRVGAGVVLAPDVKDVVVRGLVIEGPKAVGVWVPSGASARLEGVMVLDTEPDGDGNGGYAILASDGGHIELADTTVRSAASVGIYLAGGTGVLDYTEVTGVPGHGGIRVEDAPGSVILRNTIVDGCTEVGILVSNSTATITTAVVLHTIVGEAGSADGIVVRRRKNAAGEHAATAEAIITSSIVNDNARVGVLFSEGATGELSDSTISSNGQSTGWGAGVWVQSGAGGEPGVLLAGNTIQQNRFIGIGVTSGASAHVVDNHQINSTQAASVLVNDQSVDIGIGLGIFNGARGVVQGNVIGMNGQNGVLMDDPAVDTLLESNEIHTNSQFGLVIQNATAGIPPFADNDFHDNFFGATQVLGPAEPPVLVRTSDFVAP